MFPFWSDMDWPRLALFFGATLVVSLVLTPLVRRFAVSRGLLDVPGEERRVHKNPTPRLGGLAIYAAFAVGVLLTFVLGVGRSPLDDVQIGNARFEGARLLVVLLGAGIIMVVMAVDDLRGIRPLPRLLWQIGAALLVIIPGLVWPGGPNAGEGAGVVHYDQGVGVVVMSVQTPFSNANGIITIFFPVIIAVGFTLFWIVGMTNTINWIDGLDGLAAGVSVFACLILFLITGPKLGQSTLAYLPLILGAATLGFLPFNIHPARIFMGDSGAMFLGFTLAILSVIGGAKMAAALLVLGIPILDAAYLIIFRLIRGRSPMAADRGHLHHRLLDFGLSQQQVVIIFYVLSGAFGVLAFLLPSGLFKLFALIIMAFVLVALLVIISRRRFDRFGLHVRDKR